MSSAVLGSTNLNHCYEQNIIVKIYSFNKSTFSAILFSLVSVVVCIQWHLFLSHLLSCVYVGDWTCEAAEGAYVESKLKARLPWYKNMKGFYKILDFVSSYRLRNCVVPLINNILGQCVVPLWRVKFKMLTVRFSDILVTCYHATLYQNADN